MVLCSVGLWCVVVLGCGVVCCGVVLCTVWFGMPCCAVLCCLVWCVLCSYSYIYYCAVLLFVYQACLCIFGMQFQNRFHAFQRIIYFACNKHIALIEQTNIQSIENCCKK